MIYKHEQCRKTQRVSDILEDYSKKGWKLFSVTMGDMTTRFEMIFEKDNSSSQKYQYKHEQCRKGSKVAEHLDTYSKNGWRLVFHVMSDMGTRHELFFGRVV